MQTEFYVAGKRLELAKRIGKGGEGEVYLLSAEPKKAVKIYTGKRDDSREAKVKAMVRLGLARTSSLVSFPEEIVTLRSGSFAGFSMRLIEGYRPIHELYGVKSRKIYYPKADYRFLLRAATNTARAVGQVHSSSCIIGDLNHSGILVSDNATIALIDADSFQFQANGKTYPCLVGVPDFTPPELQGISLHGVIRTKIHDQFGLAVAIFQLLFMGRHPYAGRQRDGDLTLDRLIARNLFAYSRIRANGVAPPVAVATLDDFPSEIADAFERAFGLNAHQRPAAEEWVRLLQGLEGRLSRCASNQVHFYPTAAKSCPWCKMEAASGATLFLSTFTGATAAGIDLVNFDVESVWLVIKAIAIPDVQSLMPRLPALPSEPSQEARTANGTLTNKIVGAGIGLAMLALWAAYPAATILWLGGLFYAWFHFNKSAVETAPWQSKYAEADARWDEALEQWRQRLGIGSLQTLRGDLEKAVHEYRSLGSAKAQAIERLKTERRSRQLHDYLDQFLIQRASIAGIGPAKTVTLASFGIESAADITRPAILGVPGFGPATADKLLTWRSSHERRFVYNPAPLPADIQAQTKAEAEFTAKAASLAKRISGGKLEITQLANTFRQRLATDNSGLTEIAVKRAQLEVDLKFLGIAKPPKSGFAKPSPTYGAALGQSPSAPRSVMCPNCGAPMVRRMAKRGYRSGKRFWGCSRYPSCRGTRN